MKLFLKYFLFIYLLAISTFEFFVRVNAEAIYLLFPVVTFFFFYFQKKIDLIVIAIIAPFFIVFFLQGLLYGSKIMFAVTLVIRLITIYFAVKIIGKDFIKIFLQVMTVIASYSLVFYILQNVGGYSAMLSLCQKFTSLGIDSTTNIELTRPNFIIYTMRETTNELGLIRNSGPFWEPGLYVVFLNIALFLSLFYTKKVFTKVNTILILSIITTFSTAGILALIVNFSIFGLLNKGVSLPVRVLIVTILTISIPVVFSLPFMNDKIEENINKSDLSYSRFGAAIVHFNIIKDYPLTGMPWSEERYAKYADNISPNGITEIFVRYGVIAGFIFYIFLFRTSAMIMALFNEKGKGYVLFLLFLLLLFGQTIGNSPIFWAIIFVQIPLENFLIKWKQYQKIRLYNYYKQNLQLEKAE
jgi:hypothetical protein